jgi:extracellular factor (EF) 3-hydroxypalmitic acid methyl ester biosynthesis protein
VELVQRFDQLPLLASYKQHVSAGFRRFVADLVYDLQVYRSLFDEIDAGLAEESPETRAQLRRAVIEAQGPAYFSFFDQKLRELAEQVRGFSKQEHERHGFYFRRQVWDMIFASEFLRRTNVRPRGYAGDSGMMQHIYENTYVGETIFGQLMHKHPVEEPAAQAVRNRRRMIAETLAQAARDQGNGATRLRFMSVACGPAWELRDLFATAEDCARYECVLLDQDDEALAEAAREIRRVEARTGAAVSATYLRHSVRTMLRTSDLGGRFGRAHVIYSMGLFDYLSQPVARAVVGKLYQLLEPGGRLVIGNFHQGNPSRCYMEYWMDWVLLYRSEEQLLDLAAGLPGARAQISFEATRSQMFLEVQRT